MPVDDKVVLRFTDGKLKTILPMARRVELFIGHRVYLHISFHILGGNNDKA